MSCSKSSNPVDSGGNGQNFSGAPTRISGSPFPMAKKPDTLFTVQLNNFSDPEKIIIQSLQGILAQTKPRIYCVIDGSDTYSTFLADLQKSYGVTVINTYRSDLKGLLTHFKNEVSGYLLTNVTAPSIHVAISLSGIKKAVVVPKSYEDVAKSAGLSLVEDVSGQTYQQFFDKYSADANKNIVCYQVADKATFLTDYAAYTKSFFFYDSFSGSMTTQVFSRMNPNAELFGWGSDEYQLVQTASQKSIIVNAADFAQNLSVLSNFGVETKQAKYVTDPEVKENVHTVCFLMTDGDNIQWMLGDFSKSTKWYGSPNRGKVNIGWTVCPAMCELAPTVLKRFYDGAAKNDNGRDYFVAGPSGLGYIFPELYGDITTFAQRTNEYMKQADLHIVNLLGNAMNANYITPFMQQDQIDAAFYYYYSDYSGGKGQITWVNNKPVITGRMNFWGETPESMAEKLNILSTDITSSKGYSLIPVHVWSVSVDDVIQCVSLLNKNVRVVTPDEFVALIKKNVKH